MNSSAYIQPRAERERMKPSLLDNLLGECARKAVRPFSTWKDVPRGEWYHLRPKELPKAAKNWLDEIAGWLLPDWIWHASFEVMGSESVKGDVLVVWDDPSEPLLFTEDGKRVTDDEVIQSMADFLVRVSAPQNDEDRAYDEAKDEGWL